MRGERHGHILILRVILPILGESSSPPTSSNIFKIISDKYVFLKLLLWNNLFGLS